MATLDGTVCTAAHGSWMALQVSGLFMIAALLPECVCMLCLLLRGRTLRLLHGPPPGGPAAAPPSLPHPCLQAQRYLIHVLLLNTYRAGRLSTDCTVR